MKALFQQPSYRYFILLSLLLFGLMFTAEIKNGRFWLYDFQVMYGAAEAFMSGEPVYGTTFGLDTGFYKYSPLTMLFFIPFTFLDYFSASIIDFWINVLATISTIMLLEKIIQKHLIQLTRVSSLLLFSLILCGINHIVRELHLGNTNMVLLFLLTLVAKLALENKVIQAGIILSLVIFTKPYFIICGLPLLAFGYFRTIFATAISGIIFLLISVMISGTQMYLDWFDAMLAHNGYLISHHTLFSIVETWTGVSAPTSFAFPLLFVAAIGATIYFYFRSRNTKKETKQKAFLILFFTLVSIPPNILITDTEHFLFALPMVAILLFYIAQLKKAVWIALFIVLAFAYGGNSTDLFGKELSQQIDQLGVLGLSNLIIIVTVLLLFHKDKFSKSK